MKLKENAPILETGDFWYDLFQGGYVKIEEYLEGEELERVKQAVETLEDFYSTLEDEELIEEM